MSVYIDFLIDKFMDEQHELMEDLNESSASEAVQNDGGTMDANKYTASLSAIRDLLKDKNALERLEALSLVSVVTMVPIIAVMAWVLDIYGPDDSIDASMHRGMIFYKMKRVFIKDKVLT